MFGKKAQIATEYLIITGAILVAVTIIFTYSYVTNNQSMKINQANNALDKLVNKADLIYALGPGNMQFVEITLPRDLKELNDITICNDGFSDYDADCSGRLGVKGGALEIKISLIGGDSAIRRPAKAEIELDGVLKPVLTTEGRQIIKVYWCGEKICLERR